MDHETKLIAARLAYESAQVALLTEMEREGAVTFEALSMPEVARLLTAAVKAYEQYDSAFWAGVAALPALEVAA